MSGDAQRPTDAARPVEIPADASPESRAQLERLTDALLRGAIPQREYDELVPFLIPARSREDAPAASAYALLAGSAPAGVTLRCASCGSPNDTARGPRCAVCGEALTLELSAASLPPPPPAATRDSLGRVHREVFYTLTAPVGSFSPAADDSERVAIHGGLLAVDMHGTETLGEHGLAVFVLRCQWSPLGSGAGATADAGAGTTWFVSQRFSSFESLDARMRRRLGRAMPAFPAKYHWRDQLQKRRRALASYLSRLLRACAEAADSSGEPTAELDQFLAVSRQVEQLRRRALPPSVASALGAAPPDPPPTQPPSQRWGRPSSQTQTQPMDARELAQAESDVRLLEAALAAGGDLRRDQAVQQRLARGLALLPALRASADVDSPFADVDLVPRALQCQEDLERAVATYNDALLAQLSMVGSASADTQRPLAAR